MFSIHNALQFVFFLYQTYNFKPIIFQIVYTLYYGYSMLTGGQLLSSYSIIIKTNI